MYHLPPPPTPYPSLPPSFFGLLKANFDQYKITVAGEIHAQNISIFATNISLSGTINVEASDSPANFGPGAGVDGSGGSYGGIKLKNELTFIEIKLTGFILKIELKIP